MDAKIYNSTKDFLRRYFPLSPPSISYNLSDYYSSLIIRFIYENNNQSFDKGFFKHLNKGLKQKGLKKQVFRSSYFWDKLLKCCQLDNNSSVKEEAGMIEYLKKINSSEIDVLEWLHLQTIFIHFGLFNIGRICGKKARENVHQWNENVKNSLKIKYYYPFLFEEGLYKLLDKEIIEHFSQKWVKTFYSYYNLNRCIYKDGPPFNLNSINDNAFREFIEGKDIVIVGPSDVNSDDGEEIDSFDLVVKLNYMGQPQRKNPEKKGFRCDITSLTLKLSKKFQLDFSIPRDLKWVILTNTIAKNAFLSNNPGLKVVKSDLNFQVSNHAVDNLIFNTKLNHVPKLILYLLQFFPKSISLYHVDLNLNPNRERGYYSENSNDSKRMSQFLRVLSSAHDPISNYLILQRLWKDQMVFGDLGFSHVMDMGLETYLNKMQKIYGDFGRIN